MDRGEILVDDGTNFLAVTKCYLDEPDYWMKLIREGGSYDQKDTAIRLERAYCRVYQPGHTGENHLDPLRHEFDYTLNRFARRLNILGERKLKTDPSMWGLIYTDGESCGPHGHGPVWEYSAVFYLKADVGCGSIFFPTIDMEVEPEDNDLIIFNPRLQHGVMPNIISGAERIAVAMNVTDRGKRRPSK